MCTITLFGCTKENEDPKTIDLGLLEFSSTTVKNHQYTESVGLIFVDDSSNEIATTTSAGVSAFSGYSHLKNIKNSEEMFYLNYRLRSMFSALTVPDINKVFHIRTYVEADDADYESVRIADLISITYDNLQPQSVKGFYPDIFIVADERLRVGDFPNADQSTPVFTINGKTFTDVYSNEDDDTFVVYFNFEKGIVAFKDKITGISYALK